MGIKGSSTVQVFLSDCMVPKENLLGEREGGFKMALNILNSGRIKIGSSAVGGSKLAIDKSVKYANERQQFNAKISDFGAIKHKLADMAVKTFAIESATYRIGHLIDLKYQSMLASGMSPYESKLSAIREYAIECSISKVYGSDILCYVADESIQIHGGMGYATETGVERGYRDARITKIYEGTNEVNRLLIVGELMKRAFQTKEISLLPALKRAPINVLTSYFSISSPSIQKRIDNLKQLFLLLTGGVGNKFKKDLIKEQEIVMNLSDILTDIFVLESIYLRVEKAKLNNHSKSSLYMKILEVQVYDTCENVKAAGRTIINSYTTGIENKLMKKCLQSMVPDFSINIKENRRSIAMHLIENNGYSIN